ncbi:MAG: 5-formyltetrahydrofolate cyclo-ligase [Rhodospirillaceae bacterium]|nr:5-formyltetrahydrofolate cyclo-ligase [Rhodospirillaceae bacterium]
MSGDIDKAALRREAVSRRAALAAQSDSAVAGDRLRDRFLAAITLRANTAVSGYWPMRDEVDPRPLLLELHRRRHPIGLPVVLGRGEPLIFRSWRPGDTLLAGAFGVSLPAEDRDEIRPEVVIVPMLAFDLTGHRLGYGGGYYDRTLAQLRRGGGAVLAVGVAYAGQQVPRIPAGEHDQKLDWIVTEAGAARIGYETTTGPSRARPV